MERKFIIASHSTFSAGLAAALKFFAGDELKIDVITAYMDNKPVDEELKAVIDQYPAADELVILTDLKAGSVNQKVFPYLQRPHTHVITGMNLPLALALVMEPQDDYLAPTRVQAIVEEAQNQIVYMNQLNIGGAGDDDDE